MRFFSTDEAYPVDDWFVVTKRYSERQTTRLTLLFVVNRRIKVCCVYEYEFEVDVLLTFFSVYRLSVHERMSTENPEDVLEFLI